jgi:hypothetical protein
MPLLPLLPLLPPTRPLLIWAVLALACAVALVVDGVSLLGGRPRQASTGDLACSSSWEASLRPRCRHGCMTFMVSCSEECATVNRSSGPTQTSRRRSSSVPSWAAPCWRSRCMAVCACVASCTPHLPLMARPHGE